jgi:hypothetical protein
MSTTSIKEAKNHSAEGQMLGYLYQLEKALLWLSLCSDDGMVSIEMEDDVVARLQKGENFETIFEQDKSTLSRNNPYANKSINLWKTLCIWLDLASTKNADLDTSRFILATTVKIKKTCIAKKISECINANEAQKIYSALKVIANNPNKTLQPYCEAFLSYPKSTVLRLLPRITLVDNDYEDDRKILKDRIRKNLRILSDFPFNEFYWELVGMLLDKAISSWTTGQRAIFSVKSVWRQVDNWKSKHSRERFFERTKDNLPIPEISIEAEKGKPFVKQLEAISVLESEVIDSINDFLRASMERTRYAEEGRVTKGEFNEFENDLFERWKMISNRKIRLNKTEEAEGLGYDTFSEVINFKGKLAGVQTEQYYTTKGMYHKLSNNKQIGWHPKWKTLI